MKVVLIFPNYLENFHLITASFYPSLGIAMVAAAARERGHDVSVIDATAERLNARRLVERVSRLKPDLIGMTTNIAYARKVLVTGRWLKHHFPRVPVVMGGPWATTRYDAILEAGAADYVVLGEGEKTFPELLDALEKGNDVKGVKGLAFIDANSDGVFTTGPRPFISDLDSLPFPAWDLFPPHKNYFWDPRGRRFYPIMTSRGCVYGCINCTKVVHGYKMRYRSVDNVMDEIKYLREKFKMDELIIIDDGFNHDVARAENICDEIIALPFKVHIRFTNGLRADKLPPRLAWKLKRAGTYDIVLGIESGNQDVVYKMGKNLRLDAVRRSVALLKRLGIRASGFFMVGLPYENVSAMIDTKNLIKELDLDIALISRAIPFPGTRFHEIVKKRGRFLDSFEKEPFFYSHGNPAYETDEMPAELVELAFRDYYRTMYLDPRRMLNLLGTIRLKNWRVYLNFTITTLMNLFKRGNGRGTPRDVKKTIVSKIRAAKHRDGSEHGT